MNSGFVALLMDLAVNLEAVKATTPRVEQHVRIHCIVNNKDWILWKPSILASFRGIFAFLNVPNVVYNNSGSMKATL
jgi:hypothetical protein